MTPPEFEEWVLDELHAAQRQEIKSNPREQRSDLWYWRGWQDALKAVLDKMSPNNDQQQTKK